MCVSLLSSKLILTVDSTDDNYMPKRVTVYGGEGDNLKKLSDVTIDEWAFSKGFSQHISQKIFSVFHI